MPYRHAQRPPLYEYTYEVGTGDSARTFTVTAHNDEDAFDKACAEIAFMGRHDEALRCVDWYEHDPAGGDGPDD